jgi:hypothetical protein
VRRVDVGVVGGAQRVDEGSFHEALSVLWCAIRVEASCRSSKDASRS